MKNKDLIDESHFEITVLNNVKLVGFARNCDHYYTRSNQ